MFDRQQQHTAVAAIVHTTPLHIDTNIQVVHIAFMSVDMFTLPNDIYNLNFLVHYTARFCLFLSLCFFKFDFDIGRQRFYRHFDLIFALFLSSSFYFWFSCLGSYSHISCCCAVLRRALSNVNCVQYVKSVRAHGQTKTAHKKRQKSKKGISGAMQAGISSFS